MPWRVTARALVLIAAGAVCAVCGPAACSKNSGRIDRSAVAGAAGAIRPVEACLAGVAYASWGRAGGAPVSGLKLYPLARLVRERAERHPSQESLAALGLLRLISGAQAIAPIERALAAGPPDGILLNDLGAALLQEASPREPLNYVRALAAFDRALAASPALPAALFNRALTLERLTLRQDARAGWQRYLERDTASRWAVEAHRHLQGLDVSTEDEVWRRSLPAMTAAATAGRQAEVNALVSRFPQPARLHAEERSLRTWSSATARGRFGEAARALSAARAIGTALASAGDHMALDAVARIDAAERSVGGALVLGHAAYGAGLELVQANDFRRAVPLLRRAQAELARGGSPFVGWADFQLALCAYQRADDAAALDDLAGVLGRADISRYPALAGRANWLSGTILLLEGRPSESLRHYSAALARFEQLGERGNTVAVHTLLASNLVFLGDAAGAWRHRYAALAGLAGLNQPQRLRVTLGEAAAAMSAIGEPRVALYFQDELVRVAGRIGDPSQIGSALRQRAPIYQSLGRTADALRDLALARANIDRIPDRDVRETATGEALLAEGMIRSPSDGAGALTALDRALAIHARTRYRAVMPVIFLERARILMRLHADQAALASLTAGIAECERQRATVGHERRSAYFDQVHGLYAEMIRFQLERRGDAAAALTFAERGRARALLDLVSGGRHGAEASGALSGSRPVLDAAQLRLALPPDLTIIEYEMTDHELLAWVLSRDGLALRRVPVGNAELRAACTHFIRAAQGKSEADFLAISSALHGLLIQPVGDLLRRGSLLVLIPSPSLVSIPWGALRDPATGHYLIDDWPWVTAPSANVFVRCLRRVRRPDTDCVEGVLAVGSSRFREDLFPGLEPIPDAAAEARAVAARFKHALLLVGDGATKYAFLSAVSRSSIIHFAGHAVLNAANPLFSALLFARGAQPGDSGVLYAHELAGCKFEHTRLAVLSGCDTASGPGAEVEGSSGLALSFLAAGVPAVLGSLWRVDDAAARALFDRFYRYLSQGVTPATALRSAALDLRTSPEPALRAPAAWAGFELIGGDGWRRARPESGVLAKIRSRPAGISP